METRFKIVYTDEAYEFIHSLPEKVQDKIASVIDFWHFGIQKKILW